MALLLHSSWVKDRGFVVWAQPGGEPGLVQGLRHVAAFRGVAGDDLAPRVETFVARLPFCHGEIAGGRLSLSSTEPDAPVEMRGCDVEGVCLTWVELFETLQDITDDVRFARGVFGGASFLRWKEFFMFAAALVARGRYLPGVLEEKDGGFSSRWIPAFDYAEHVRFGALIERLPAVAWCLAPPQGADAAATAFLEECVDRLVRAACVTRLSRVHAANGRFYSAHDAWISALRGDLRTIRWDKEDELRGLVSDTDWWQRPALAGVRGVSRWHISIDAPETPNGAWHLRMRATAEQGEPDMADEALLTALGHASTLCPYLRGMDNTLTTLEVHQFLRVYSPMLSTAGFVVESPPWWQDGRRAELTLRGRMDDAALTPAGAAEEPATADGGWFAMSRLVKVDWQVVLGGEPVTEAELAALAASGEPLAWFRGAWVEVDKQAVREAVRITRHKGAYSEESFDFVRLLLGVDEAAHGLRVEGVEAGGWLRNVMRKLRGGGESLRVPALPKGFDGTLRPYQSRGYAWLLYLRGYGLGACLADDMGLGKTVQALAAIQRIVETGATAPMLLVCPMSVMTNWVREAARFTPKLRVRLHHGAQRSVGESFAAEAATADLVVTSYHLLYRDYNALRRVAWGGLIYDEAQNLKNPETRQSQVARALTAPFRVALTGTPLENHVGDLWSLMDILNPGLLGSRKSFREKFMRPMQAAALTDSRERLKRIVQPFILRRHKLDPGVADDLPAKREGKVFCRLTKEQAALYRDVLDSFKRDMKAASGRAKRGLIFGVLTRLKQTCNHPAQLLHEQSENERLAGRSGKLERLEEMLGETFESGEASLIFTQYAEMGHLLQRHIRETFGLEAPFLHGGVPRKDRDRMVSAFQDEQGPPVFILSLRAGGTGLNLTRATQVFHYDRWWNPAVEDQATDRAFRIGQTRNVMVHKFIAAGTLEDHIDDLITSKLTLADELVGSGESWVAHLDEQKLNEVLALSQER